MLRRFCIHQSFQANFTQVRIKCLDVIGIHCHRITGVSNFRRLFFQATQFCIQFRQIEVNGLIVFGIQCYFFWFFQLTQFVFEFSQVEINLIFFFKGFFVDVVCFAFSLSQDFDFFEVHQVIRLFILHCFRYNIHFIKLFQRAQIKFHAVFVVNFRDFIRFSDFVQLIQIDFCRIKLHQIGVIDLNIG